VNASCQTGSRLRTAAVQCGDEIGSIAEIGRKNQDHTPTRAHRQRRHRDDLVRVSHRQAKCIASTNRPRPSVFVIFDRSPCGCQDILRAEVHCRRPNSTAGNQHAVAACPSRGLTYAHPQHRCRTAHVLFIKTHRRPCSVHVPPYSKQRLVPTSVMSSAAVPSSYQSRSRRPARPHVFGSGKSGQQIVAR